jgi:class 3 adenylate cyclase
VCLVSENGVERRLTTILSADVVGYSRLVGQDEAGTVSALKTLRKELVEPKLAQYHGRIVKLMGDGALMEFSSVVDAVVFAVEVQTAMRDRNVAVPEDGQIAYRIGINIGDIIVEGDDIYGDGVNVAARLEGLAEPGGICASRTVINHVKGKIDLNFEDLGDQEVKNISEPVRVYRVALDDKSAALATPVVDTPVGVVPFRRWQIGAAAAGFCRKDGRTAA